MESVRIKEHSLGTYKDLELHPGDRHLVGHLDEHRMLTIREARHGIEVSSHSHVGMAKFEDFEVIVEPKIQMMPQNLSRLIAYAFGFEGIKTLKNKAGFVPEYNNLVDVLIDFFVSECRYLMARGLLKSYVKHEEDVSFLRGRLVLQQQLINMIRKKPSFVCEFDELEYDNLENRILLYCLKLCASITKSSHLKKDTRMLVGQLSHVIRYPDIPPDFEQVRYTRLNQHYKPLHKLAKMIIDSIGVGDFASQNAVNSFFVDMNRVFELFVTRLFDEHHPYKVQPQKSRKAWSAGEKKIHIRPDILLDSKIIVDVKYKEEVSLGDLYQIGFYIHEYGQRQGYAILPKSKSEMKEDITSERQNITISVRTIDMDDMLNRLHAKEHETIRKMMLELVPEK